MIGVEATLHSVTESEDSGLANGCANQRDQSLSSLLSLLQDLVQNNYP